MTQDRQIRSFAIAFAAAVIAAVATMFLPLSALESAITASGISEVIPAAMPPLGDTARALVAFGVGVLMLALVALVLLRQGPEAALTEDNLPDEESDAPSLRDRIAGLRMKMPWNKGEDDITELADLPRLRGGDSHPDAPARRPLSATQDLPVLDLTRPDPEPAIVELAVEPQSEAAAVPTPVPAEPGAIATPREVTALPSLAEMVAQLEESVTQRKQQLADLEVVAAKLAAEKTVAVEQVDATPAADPVEITPPVVSERPPLEAVAAPPAKSDEMDEALAQALATLHRMNGTGG